jgi:dienelactone hydrolase
MLDLGAQYYYYNEPRLQLCFPSPNHCATVFAMLLIAGVVFVPRLFAIQGTSLRILSLILVGSGFGLGLLGLALTYSRGGWVSFGAGLLFLICTCSKLRVSAVGAMVIFAVILLLAPMGADRFKSISDSEDLSIGHRLMVWRGAAAMTSDRWLTGYGAGNFGAAFTAWFQPFGVHTKYSTAINNLLTLGAERGILVLAFFLVATITPWWMAFKIASKHGHKEVLAILAAQLVFFVSGIFTYSLTIWYVSGLFWTFFLMETIYLIVRFKAGRSIPFVQLCVPPLVFSCLLCLMILALGCFELAILPTSSKPVYLTGVAGVGDAMVVQPQQTRILGIVIFYHDQGQTIEGNGQQIIRPLAASGFIVVAVNYRDTGVTGLDDIRRINRWAAREPEFQSLPLYLVGYGAGGRLALLSCCYDSVPKVRGIVSIAANAEWPFPRLSPEEHISDLNCPLLILHGTNDEVVPVDQALKLKNLCVANKKMASTVIFQGYDHDFNDNFPITFDAIRTFCMSHLN